ncbi:phage tail protein [Phytohabitans sp. LJ34]|uniref:phage tail protein n=1 Tax=Phytohabitans sp. LJ34 TaxID=3452217 RepID=UPI003F8B2B54
MTQPASSIGQQLIQQLTAPLQEAATAFSTKVAESLAKQVEGITTSFREANPAVTAVTDAVVGWSGAVTMSAGSVAGASGSVRDMIRNTREMRQEITKVLDGIPALDGLRLRFMQVTDAVKNLNMETVRGTAIKVRDAVTTRVVAAAKAVWNAITKVVTVAMRALNLVMRLNPIGLVVTAIMLLIGGLVLAYQRSTTFRNIVNAAFSAVRNVAISVFNAIRNAVAAVWPFVSRVIQIAVTVIRMYVTTYFTVVRTVVTTVFNAVRAIATAVWGAVRAVVTGAVNTVVSTVRRVQQVYTVVRDAFNRARSAAGDAIGGVVSFVRGLPGRIVSALGNIGRTLYQSGRDLVQGFINGLRDMAGRVVSAIRDSILDRIPGPIKGFLGIGSPSRLMAEIGRNVGEGLVVGIDDSRDMVAEAMTNLVPTPRAATIRPALAGLAQATVARAAPGAGPVTARAGTAEAAPVTVNVYPRAGQSEYEIGQVAARELAWAAKH